ncbi:class I SAM-dependent methyltransferase [Actinokineospora guangxiensis]|uniref:Class I SAM-dependent methyltransferase n=1 Tax=Actinokineospora guangxiensis TaxID=1490288 RepID=A0ABW0ESK9_9PSEU
MAHTHDGLDWTERIAEMRRTDALEAEVNGWVAEKLVAGLPDGAVVVDVGSGSGGMAAAFASALAARGGGRLVLVDATRELLHAAAEAARTGGVEVELVEFDAADDGLADAVPAADLVWASRVVHHLPDERAGVARLAGLVRPGGTLALVEGGLSKRCLPWDLGIGRPGLEDRLHAARAEWFTRMRQGMAGVVRAGVGWNRLLADAGLTDVRAFSYLVDLPAPGAEPVRRFVADWLAWFAGVTGEFLSADDRETVAALLDEDGDHWVGHRDDVFVLAASTAHLGTR